MRPDVEMPPGQLVLASWSRLMRCVGYAVLCWYAICIVVACLDGDWAGVGCLLLLPLVVSAIWRVAEWIAAEV